jgi:hypothetical protein
MEAQQETRKFESWNWRLKNRTDGVHGGLLTDRKMKLKQVKTLCGGGYTQD